MREQRVGNIALINTEREHANSVVNNDIDRIIDIFGRWNGRDSYFFSRVLWAHMIDPYERIFSLHV